MRSRHPWIWFPVVLSAAGCATTANDTTPERTIEAYVKAMREGNAPAAHALLSREQRERVSTEAFAEQARHYARETAGVTETLSSPALSVEQRAHVVLLNGAVLDLVQESEGHWRIASPVGLYYDQSSPRAALKSFVGAMREQRWEVVLRLMPEQARGDLDAEQLGQNLMDQRLENERMLALLEASLDAPIERTGNRATMPYGDRFAVRFVKEGELWKIEDPE